MDDLAQVLHLRFTFIILRQAQIHLDAGLIYKEPYQSKVKVKKTLMTSFKNGEQLILIIIELCRHSVCRDNRPFVLLNPWGLVINLYLCDRYLMRSAFMQYRKRKHLYAFCSIESASVSIRLLLKILAGLDINDRRRQLE